MIAKFLHGRTENLKVLIFEIIRTASVAICIFISLFLVSCKTSRSTSVFTTSTVVKMPPPTTVKTKPILTSTVTMTPAIETDSQISSDMGELLRVSVLNLENASSFRMAAHVVRAYRGIDPSGEIMTVVFGEFNTSYAVIRLPTLKVVANYEERYNPEDGFVIHKSYTYRDQDKYFIQFIEDSINGDGEEIDLNRIEPFAGDVYQTLVTYADQAKFVTESDGIAVYILDHPEWYRLEGAIGFADLGFLHAQENSELLIKQYVAEHYPNVKTIRFTIYVSKNEQVIMKVIIDDVEFMVSVWAEIDRALIEVGAKSENLTQYEVMSANGAEYLFSNYNQVQDFEVP